MAENPNAKRNHKSYVSCKKRVPTDVLGWITGQRLLSSDRRHLRKDSDE